MRWKQILRNLNVANQLTFLRLAAVPFFILAMLEQRFVLATGLFALAAITDLLDGVSARMLGVQTPLGAILDPAADKLLMTSAFVMLTRFPSMLSELDLVARIPLWLTILTISRDVFIVGVSLALYLAYGQTRFEPSGWGKWATTAGATTVTAFLLANALRDTHVMLDVLVWITLLLTLVSGTHYMLRTMRAVRDHGAGAGRTER